MAAMAIMSLTAMLVICVSLQPSLGQEQPAEALVAGRRSGWPSESRLTWLPSWPPAWLPPALRCGWGEVYKRCASSSCAEKRCSDIGKPKRIACTADCRSGCFCMRGFFRSEQGRCVLRLQCPQSRLNWFERS
uniref:TIL domain containing protein n=1 Tax=Rhipicephalus appendiculatus TaxID=34631 RepID=A0A131Z483_RHIAP